MDGGGQWEPDGRPWEQHAFHWTAFYSFISEPSSNILKLETLLPIHHVCRLKETTHRVISRDAETHQLNSAPCAPLSRCRPLGACGRRVHPITHQPQSTCETPCSQGRATPEGITKELSSLGNNVLE